MTDSSLVSGANFHYVELQLKIGQVYIVVAPVASSSFTYLTFRHPEVRELFVARQGQDHSVRPAVELVRLIPKVLP